MLRGLRLLRAVLVLTTVVVAGAALWIAVANPTVEGTSLGVYRCLAPYDIVLNDAVDPMGGEPPPDDARITSRCREAGEERFDQAVYVGVAAGIPALAAAGVGVLLYRRDRRLAG